MSNLQRIMDEDRRLLFLRILAADADYAGNNFVVKEALSVMGHSVSHDRVATDAAWLEEQGLIATVTPAPGLSVHTITRRGKEVAQGLAVVPGVKKPEPGLDY